MSRFRKAMDPLPARRELGICRKGLVGATLLASGAVLSGCAGSLDWFESTPAASDAASSKAEAPKPAAVAAIKIEDNCPTVDIRSGAGTLSVTNPVQQATASDVRYQLTFIQVARQCALNGQTLTMRVGIQGRAVVGPAGAPNQIEVPLRYAVVREGPEPKTIVTKFKRLSADLPPGAPNTVFTDIEDDLSFPLPPIDELTAYVVYVGFDEIGDRNDRRPPAKKGRAK